MTRKSEREASHYIDPNETALHKVVRIFGYIKIPLIAAAALIGVIAVLTLLPDNRPKDDLYVLLTVRSDSSLASKSGNFGEAADKITALLLPYIEDMNGDGKATVSVETVILDRTEESGMSAAEKESAYGNSDRYRIETALEGNCFLIIADTEGAEYVNALGLAENLDYLGCETEFSGKAYSLNLSGEGCSSLGLSKNGEKYYLLMKQYYDTVLVLKEDETAWAEMTEKIILCLSDPEFDPETDSVPLREEDGRK